LDGRRFKVNNKRVCELLNKSSAQGNVLKNKEKNLGVLNI
jgi:hypothetical protein